MSVSQHRLLGIEILYLDAQVFNFIEQCVYKRVDGLIILFILITWLIVLILCSPE